MRLAVLLLSIVALGSCASGQTPDGDNGAPGPGAGTTPEADGGEVAIDGGGAADDAGANQAGGSDDSSAGPIPDAASDDEGAPALDAPASGPGPYGADGPYAVTTAALQVPAPNGTFTTTAYVPSTTEAGPAVILSSGFFQTGAAYAPFAHRLASWGIITFLRDDPNLGETTPKVVSDVTYEVTTWLAATSADSASAVHGKIDTSRVGLAGHSRGGQISLLAGEALFGKIKGVFGLDPVDTASSGDPQARTALATIGVPLAFIGETTDSAASSCAPAADNYQVLYQAAGSPAVAITAINADHTMFEDAASCAFCSACTAGTASQPAVLATAVRYLTAYFARQLLGDATVGATFAGAGIDQDTATGLVSVVSK